MCTRNLWRTTFFGMDSSWYQHNRIRFWMEWVRKKCEPWRTKLTNCFGLVSVAAVTNTDFFFANRQSPTHSPTVPNTDIPAQLILRPVPKWDGFPELLQTESLPELIDCNCAAPPCSNCRTSGRASAGEPKLNSQTFHNGSWLIVLFLH